MVQIVVLRDLEPKRTLLAALLGANIDCTISMPCECKVRTTKKKDRCDGAPAAWFVGSETDASFALAGASYRREQIVDRGSIRGVLARVREDQSACAIDHEITAQLPKIAVFGGYFGPPTSEY